MKGISYLMTFKDFDFEHLFGKDGMIEIVNGSKDDKDKDKSESRKTSDKKQEVNESLILDLISSPATLTTPTVKINEDNNSKGKNFIQIPVNPVLRFDDYVKQRFNRESIEENMDDYEGEDYDYNDDEE